MKPRNGIIEMVENSLKLTGFSPLKIVQAQKETIVCQPSIFRCENVSFREGIIIIIIIIIISSSSSSSSIITIIITTSTDPAVKEFTTRITFWCLEIFFRYPKSHVGSVYTLNPARRCCRTLSWRAPGFTNDTGF